jgi:hypothetical protein
MSQDAVGNIALNMICNAWFKFGGINIRFSV